MRGFMLGWSRMFEVRTSNSTRKEGRRISDLDRFLCRLDHSMAQVGFGSFAWRGWLNKTHSGVNRVPAWLGSVLEELLSMCAAD
jgi:hypothetical protein